MARTKPHTTTKHNTRIPETTKQWRQQAQMQKIIKMTNNKIKWKNIFVNKIFLYMVTLLNGALGYTNGALECMKTAINTSITTIATSAIPNEVAACQIEQRSTKAKMGWHEQNHTQQRNTTHAYQKHQNNGANKRKCKKHN